MEPIHRQRRRRTIGAIAAITILLAFTSALLSTYSARPFVDTFALVTAIDQWHPNWPGNDVVAATLNRPDVLKFFAWAVGLVGVCYIALVTLKAGVSPEPRASAAGGAGLATVAQLEAAVEEPTGTVGQYRAALVQRLVAGGMTAEDAAAAVEAAEAEVDGLRKRSAGGTAGAPWKASMRDALIGEVIGAGNACQTLTMDLRTDVKGRTFALAQFLNRYDGRPVLPLRKIHGAALAASGNRQWNIDGVILQNRPDRDLAADRSLMALLAVAFIAHDTAARDDGSGPDEVNNALEGLRRHCRREALMGFIPAEIAAEAGHSGVATPEELERWAIAQVVECVGTSSPETVEVGL